MKRLKKTADKLEKKSRLNKNRMISDWVKEKDDRSHDEIAAQDQASLDNVEAKLAAKKKGAYMGDYDDEEAKQKWMEEQGWKEGFDEASGKPYWFNEKTGESVWEKPKKPKKEKSKKEQIEAAARGDDKAEKERAARLKKMEQMKANKAKRNAGGRNKRR